MKICTSKSVLFLLFVSINCINCSKSQKETEPELDENQGCKLISEISETTNFDEFGNLTPYRQHSEKRYQLNEKLYPISTDEILQSWNNEVEQVKRVVHANFLYNKENFLLSQQWSGEFKSLQNNSYVTTIDTSSSTYKYQNGRLMAKMSGNGILTDSYEYSSTGALTKYISVSVYNRDQTIMSFNNGILAAVSETKPSLNAEITYNDMGYESIVKFKDQGLEYRNTYDETGNYIKIETYTNSVLTSYTDYVYDRPNLKEKADINFKGHPKIPSLLGSDSKLEKSSISYERKVNGNDFVKSSQTTLDYDFNSLGYCTALRLTINRFKTNGHVQSTIKTTETFLYQNCK